jgi:hypothetical protein
MYIKNLEISNIAQKKSIKKYLLKIYTYHYDEYAHSIYMPVLVVSSMDMPSQRNSLIFQ